MQLQRTLNSLLVLILLLISCSKRVTDLQTLEHNVKAAATADSSSYSRIKRSVELKSFTISDGENDYLVNIVPDGEFRFDLNTGFTGKAKSISIRGKQKLKTASGSNSVSALDSMHKKTVKTSAKLQDNTFNKKKKTETQGIIGPVKWIALLVLILTFLFFGLKPLKKAITWLKSYWK